MDYLLMQTFPNYWCFQMPHKNTFYHLSLSYQCCPPSDCQLVPLIQVWLLTLRIYKYLYYYYYHYLLPIIITIIN